MEQEFVRNCWYVAATGGELGRELLGRTFLDTPVVMFRREDGTPAALEDRCAHRFLPLSKGYLIGDRVQCGYHGMEFNCEGACVHVPGQDSIPNGSTLKTFPIAEKQKLIWIWMGDPALADEDLIPDIWRNDHPEWTCIVGNTFHVDGQFRLFLDNLMDPSHVSFVHKTTLGTDNVAEIPQQASQDGNSVKVARWILDSPPAPTYAQLGGFTGHVDRWQIMTFMPPHTVEVDMGSADAGSGAPEGNRSSGIELRAYNLVTPETADSCWYFWTHVRNFRLEDQETSDRVRALFVEAFEEDVAVIEGVQAGLKRYPDLTPVNLRIDGGPVMVRRILEDIIAEETATGAPSGIQAAE